MNKFFRDLKNFIFFKRNKLFDEVFYLRKYSDVRKADVDPFWHFIKRGIYEKRWPNNLFNWDDFYNSNCDIKYFIKKRQSNQIFLSCSNLKNDNYSFNPNEFEKFPLVSIIILTRNGSHYIKNLFKFLKMNTFYPNFEVIVVDNNSNDDTLSFLSKNIYNFKLKIIKNFENKSFSIANNEAVNLAEGELLLFLNNDVIPLKGWLCELVKECLNNPKVGSIGSKLIYPNKKDFKFNCKIQHVGIAFRYEGDFYRPYNIGNGQNINNFNEKAKRAALTAACLLVRKDRFLEVGGFDENYKYGYEDVDLGLKLLKKGYENIYMPTSILYHYEFGTQNKDKSNEIRKRRLNNIKIFQKKWHVFIKKRYWEEKINSKNFLFSEKPLHIAFAVSNKGENVAEGDYFTALELANEFKKFGWKTSFLSRKHNEWYELDESIDILIVLIDSYDLSKIKCKNKKIITIAWARNWFDRWIKNKSFYLYDFIFASSKQACEYIEKHSGKKAILFPIATNENRFSKNNENMYNDFFKCDYCFTGSYWNDDRDIINKLNPDKLPFKFHIYGKNWEKFDKFKPYYKGFVSYKEMPKVYSNTKIVIDDANRVTKPFGSVNSRVFDALASGVLVITNGKLGSLELFDGKLPYYETSEELEKLLNLYLNDEDLRLKKIKELQKIVLEKHTYYERAKFFKNFLKEIFIKKSIVINIAVPKWEVVKEWGDYYFAKSLKKYLERIGYRVLLQILPEWENNNLFEDVVLVLRGLNRYNLKNYHFNIMWNISHPDKVENDEYSSYDYVYIASIYWSKHVREVIKKDNISYLLQCTDPEIFKHIDVKEDIDILFVGNSRNVFRKIIKDLLPVKYTVYIFGSLWEKFIDSKYIKGKNIPNEKLFIYYNKAKIILNDHWNDMREKGFISNRIFDVSACRKFIITDKVLGLEDIFKNSIIVYDGTRENLLYLIDKYINDKALREEKALLAQQIVLNSHTFEHRVREIDMMLKKYCYYEE